MPSRSRSLREIQKVAQLHCIRPIYCRFALRPKGSGGAYLGIAIFPVTSPVSVVATLTIPSAPAEKSRLPSKVKASDRQPALWRRVRQVVSTLLWPLVLDASALDSGLESRGSAGKRTI